MEALGVRSGPARGLLVMCLSVVGVLAVAHLAHLILGRPSDRAFHLGIDRGFGEVFFMVLTVWVVALLMVVGARLRSGLPLAWAAAFAYLFLDDWFRVHERVGLLIGPRLGADFHVGELVWLLSVAVVLGSTLLGMHLRSRGDARTLSAVLVGLGLAALFCGVVLDLAHGRNTSEAVEPWITLLEDGGEIAVMSVVVAFLFAVAYTGHRPRVGRRWGTLLGVPRELQRGFGS
jgi:hypothetical protein